MDSELVLGKIDERFELPNDEISPRGGTGFKKGERFLLQNDEVLTHGDIEWIIQVLLAMYLHCHARGEHPVAWRHRIRTTLRFILWFTATSFKERPPR
jgi:hypothetical protein